MLIRSLNVVVIGIDVAAIARLIQQISDEMLAPGWTTYFRRVLYHGYDVSGFVRRVGLVDVSYGGSSGDNVVGMMIGLR